MNVRRDKSLLNMTESIDLFNHCPGLQSGVDKELINRGFSPISFSELATLFLEQIYSLFKVCMRYRPRYGKLAIKYRLTVNFRSAENSTVAESAAELYFQEKPETAFIDLTMPQPTTSIAIQTDRLTRLFGSFVAVKALNLVVQSGEVFGLLGPNGAGKTTTIRMLTTMLPPSSGSAMVAGYSVLDNPVGVRKHMGYVSQMISADGALTGYENLLLFARIYGVPKAERRQRIDDALHFMGLTDARDKLVRAYSGGMIRRLEIAQSMLHRPQVLFLDEPTIGLDPAARHQVRDRLKELRRSFGTTILVTTHDMDEAEDLCDRIAIMKSGSIAAEGSPEELKRQAGTDSMDEVFIHFAGEFSDTTNYQDAARTRKTARRLG